MSRVPVAQILIVEDESLIRQNVCGFFATLSEEKKRENDAPDFAVESAGTGEEAQKRLSEARARYRPYDVMVLDLGLPWMVGHDNNDPQIGLRILQQADDFACSATVVRSKFDDVHTLAE